MSIGHGRRSMAARLLAAQLLVIIAGSLTLAITALAIGPALFRVHARQALVVLPPDVARHLERGFGDALLLALAVATATAVVTALAASWLLALQLVRPIRTLAEAAERIGQGTYDVRVPVPASGEELTTLGTAFNKMAAALESTEHRHQALLADLAHELRTPLATLEGYVEGLADGVVPADEEAWTVLQAELARLRRLAEDLTAVSRAEEQRLDLRRSPVDPGALVSAAVQAAQPAFAAKGVALQASIDQRLPSVAADADRIGEVLANLLGNALQHTPSGGLVEVTARDAEMNSSWPWPTPARGSRRSYSSTCSSGSSRSTRPAPATGGRQRDRADHHPGDRGRPRRTGLGRERRLWSRHPPRRPTPDPATHVGYRQKELVHCVITS